MKKEKPNGKVKYKISFNTNRASSQGNIYDATFLRADYFATEEHVHKFYIGTNVIASFPSSCCVADCAYLTDSH